MRRLGRYQHLPWQTLGEP